MYKLCIPFLLIAFSVQSQRVFIKGTLLDADTKKPVMYANISFLNSSDGISSKEDGTFELSVFKNYLKGKVHISCLNYKDTIVNAKDLIDATLNLQSKTEVLNEIILSRKLEQQLILDPVKRNIISMHSRGLRMVAKYFPNTKANKCCKYLTKVTIEFPKRINKKAKFRFRIFDMDTKTGTPKNDLLLENIPVNITENQKNVELDITDQNIEMPENGFFVAFEKLFIPYNKYGTNTDPGGGGKGFYAPIIGVTKSKFYKRNIGRNFIFTKGKWLELPYTKYGKLKGYVPAISVTLSN